MAGRPRTRAKAAAKAKAQAKAETKSPQRHVTEKWELQEAICWLALTDNVRESARITGLARSTVQRISQQHQDQILMTRAEMGQTLRQEFDATIRRSHQRIREIVDMMETKQDVQDLATPLLNLAHMVQIHTERRQVIQDLPGTIDRRDGNHPPASSIGEAMRERVRRDREYLREVLGGELPQGMEGEARGEPEDVEGDDEA